MIQKHVETTNIYPDYVVVMETGDGKTVLASVNPLDHDRNHAIDMAESLIYSTLGVGTLVKRKSLFKIKQTESGIPVWVEVKRESSSIPCSGVDLASGESKTVRQSFNKHGHPTNETPKRADCPQKKEDKPSPLTIWDMVKVIKDKFNITPVSVVKSCISSTAVYQSFEVRHYPKNPDGFFAYHFYDTNSGSTGDVEYVLNSLSKRLKMVPTSDGKETIWDAIFAIKEKFGVVPVEVEPESGLCYASAMYNNFNMCRSECDFKLGQSKGLSWPIPPVADVADVLQTIKAYKLTGE